MKAIGSRVNNTYQLERTFNELASLSSTALIAEKSLKDNKSVSDYLCHDLDSVYRACQTMCAQESAPAKQVKEAASKLKAVATGLGPAALATGATAATLGAANVAAGELRRQGAAGIKQTKANNPTRTV